MVIKRLPGPLRDGISQPYRGNVVQPSQTQRGLFLSQLGDSVLVVGISNIFGEKAGLSGIPAVRTTNLPHFRSQLPPASRNCIEKAVRAAHILTFSINRLRGCDNHLLHGKPVADDGFKQQGRTLRIHVQETRKVRHVILIGRLVENNVNVAQGELHGLSIGDIATNERDRVGQVSRPPVGMNLGIERIEDPYGKSVR